MGQAVVAAVEGADDMRLAGRADPALGTTLADVLADADVVVDCTSSSGPPGSTSTRCGMLAARTSSSLRTSRSAPC
jgi:hypothetical protein